MYFLCVWFFNAPFHFREENKLRKDKLKILFKNKRENEKKKVLNNQSSTEQHHWALLKTSPWPKFHSSLLSDEINYVHCSNRKTFPFATTILT